MRRFLSSQWAAEEPAPLQGSYLRRLALGRRLPLGPCGVPILRPCHHFALEAKRWQGWEEERYRDNPAKPMSYRVNDTDERQDNPIARDGTPPVFGWSI